MTSLELKLASILELIGQARAARDPLVLAALLQRKDAICAALAAPEQSWHEACVQPLPPARGGRPGGVITTRQ
jgi:hypothetical protein